MARRLDSIRFHLPLRLQSHARIGILARKALGRSMNLPNHVAYISVRSLLNAAAGQDMVTGCQSDPIAPVSGGEE